MRSRRFALLICVAILPLASQSRLSAVHAQTPGQPPASREKATPSTSSPKTATEPSTEVKAVTQAILEEIDKHSELMANIEYLCDMIGPRLTGSPGLTRASHWTRDKFKQYGLSNVRLEPWTIHQAWTRGEARGRVLEPTVQRLLLESAGWSPSTKGPPPRSGGPRQGRVGRGTVPYKGKLKGAWVVSKPVSVQPTPRQGGQVSLNAEVARRFRDFPRMMRFSQDLKTFLAAEGPPACCTIRTRSMAW